MMPGPTTWCWPRGNGDGHARLQENGSWSRFESLLEGADLVVTGEGSLDRQTLLGKTPAGVAAAARSAGVPVIAVCGRAGLTEEIGLGIPAEPLFRSPGICMRDADRLLGDLSARVAEEWLDPIG